MTERQSRRSRAIGVGPREPRAASPALTEATLSAKQALKAKAKPAVKDRAQGASTQGAGGVAGELRPRTRPLDELLKLSGLQPESRLTLAELAVIVGSQTGRRPSSSTCWRWALQGVRGKKLDVIRIGGTLYTTWASVEAFLADQPTMGCADQRPPATRPARETVAGQMAAARRQRDREAAKRHLDQVCSPRRRAPR